ncbi:hypothetical protein NDK47_14305 [Brevibacillus ruminantium]|uniref:Uncharacterized protein n=1 Tax=Brevibacillus ruminantium TaxID=2950604 RepID=A0ABY4WP37_9BACL|nr:hypothetical protein NDK47_14305 [Brevibacillus ruminantium]
MHADLDLIAQSLPHTKTRFVSVTVDQAIEARMQKKGAGRT